MVLVHALNLEAERGSEVLLVADHHVDVAAPARD